MANLGGCFFLLVLCFSCLMIRVEPSFARRSRTTVYIEESCRSTRYPALCVHCLSGFAGKTSLHSPEELAQLALSVSLYKARVTRAYLVKVGKQLKAINATEYQTVEDCQQQINSGIDQLGQSIGEIRRLRSDQNRVTDDSFMHIDNVNTWVSAALTDASDCVAQFPVRNMSKLKATIKAKVLNVAQVTSNALALFHSYAARYRAAAGKQP